MSTVGAGGAISLAGELRKLPAFARRDLLTLLSYRFAIVSDWVNLFVQLLIFGYVSKLVPSDRVPQYGSAETSYISFVVIGIAVSTFLQIGLGRASSALRGEQFMGTLESLFATPTSPVTIQFGAAVYDCVYIPVRTVAFLGLATLLFDVPLMWSGVLPTLLVLLVFIPFVWGLGAVSAACLLTFRRGGGAVGIVASLLGIASGAYFPLDLLPGWVSTLAAFNPIAVALDAARQLLFGGPDLTVTLTAVLHLFPAAVLGVLVGFVAMHAAVRRERRLGTLGEY